MQIYVLSPVVSFTETPASFGTAEISTEQKAPIEVRDVGSIRFDFGVESAAWLEFDSPDLTGAVEMSISEYDEPAVESTAPKHPQAGQSQEFATDTRSIKLARISE